MAKLISANVCSYCEQPYNKKDFSICPHCGGDGGGISPKGWKPTKKHKKEYAKNNKFKLN